MSSAEPSEEDSMVDSEGDAEVGPDRDATLAEALHRLPLFPLPNVVLFPHALLPLHIFEERYRALTRDILAGTRLFAVSLITPDASEHDERPPVRAIAGVGEVIMAHELPDGRFNLVVRGRARVHIDEELPSDLPYRLVAATLLPDAPVVDPAEIRDADQALRALVGQLADLVPEMAELLRQMIVEAETPSELVDAVASALIVNPTLRQRLLETREVGKRIERVTSEIVAMTSRIGVPGSVN
jgi:ATP-dependent Lon protease